MKILKQKMKNVKIISLFFSFLQLFAPFAYLSLVCVALRKKVLYSQVRNLRRRKAWKCLSLSFDVERAVLFLVEVVCDPISHFFHSLANAHHKKLREEKSNAKVRRRKTNFYVNYLMIAIISRMWTFHGLINFTRRGSVTKEKFLMSFNWFFRNYFILFPLNSLLNSRWVVLLPRQEREKRENCG